MGVGDGVGVFVGVGEFVGGVTVGVGVGLGPGGVLGVSQVPPMHFTNQQFPSSSGELNP